jgi:hypothetical protein
MTTIRLVLGLAVSCWCAAAGATVTVTFSDPAQFHDASLRDGPRATAEEPALREIGRYLSELGKRYLDPASVLQVEVLDVDLAGRFEPWRAGFRGVRFMDNLTWPSIRLRYTLLHEGRVEDSREERIVDTMYLARQRTWFASERLGYEKQMLDDWFRDRFAGSTP